MPAPDPSAPNPASGLSLDDRSIRQLVFRELTRTIQSLAGLRFGACAVLATLTVLFALFEGPTFKLWLLLAVSLAAFAVALHKPRLHAAPGALLLVFGAVFVFHTTLILVTGGIESPFMVLYIPVAVILAVGAGDRRLFLPLVLAPIGAVWVFTWLHIARLSSALLPGLFYVAGERYTVTFWLTFAVVMSGIMLVGGFFGLKVRGALDRAVRVAAEARAEVLAVSQERNRELIELLGALAHELKNPLACIQGLSGLVARKLPAGEKPAEQMAVVNDEVKRMGAIIEEFLNFSRPLQELNLEEVDPVVLAREVAAMHEAEALRRAITLRASGAAGLQVRCDPRKLKQVLVNLVQNALEAAPDAGHVTLGAADVTREGDGARLVITVDDDGAGFGAGHARFFTPGLTTKRAGSGLGLTIARVIVEQHGGSLELSDREGGGGRVLVSLPRSGPAATSPTP